MINYYIVDLAKKMQIPLSTVTVIDDSSAKNIDSRLLKLSSGEHSTFVLLQQKDLDGFHPSDSTLVKTKVQMALERLSIQIEPYII